MIQQRPVGSRSHTLFLLSCSSQGTQGPPPAPLRLLQHIFVVGMGSPGRHGEPRKHQGGIKGVRVTEAEGHKGTEGNKINGTCWEPFHLCDEMKEGFNPSCVMKVSKHPPALQHLSGSSARPAAAVLPALILVCRFEKVKYRKASAPVSWMEGCYYAALACISTNL